MKTLLIVLSLIALVGCSDEKELKIPGDAGIAIDEQSPKDVPKKGKRNVQLMSYSITKETVNEARTTAIVTVLLSEEVSEIILADIAKAVRKERQQYQRVEIYYRLQGKSPTGSPWAIAHFSPELIITILGFPLDPIAKTSTARSPERY